jgi:hypothetical protein
MSQHAEVVRAPDAGHDYASGLNALCKHRACFKGHDRAEATQTVNRKE